VRYVILGAGRVGSALAAALARAGRSVELRSARRFRGDASLRGGLVVLAVRDAEVTRWAERLAEGRRVARGSAVVHVAGALGPGALDALRGRVAGVGLAHPAASFPDRRGRCELRGAALVLAGEPVAVRRGAALGRAVGLVPRPIERLDPVGYHAACALAANGGVALAAAAAAVLRGAGVPASIAPRILGPLLRTVAENVERLGPEGALSGPIRRGDAGAVVRHLERLRDLEPTALPLYVALGARQVQLTRELGDVDAAALARVEAALAQRRRPARRG
jgi:predicted short-subunit dehydrogenase-like oxidoreductase (DUF2520 family)